MNTETEKLDDTLETRLMKLPDAMLAAMPSWATNDLSKSFSTQLPIYMQAIVTAEQKRRQFQTAEHPPLNASGWDNLELLGSLTLTNLWWRVCADPFTEHFLQRLHDTILCEVANRLMNNQPEKKNANDI